MIRADILSEEQKRIFETLKSESWIKNFYLAGGTALALQIGHRKSEDFDFFIQTDINNEELLQNIGNLYGFELLSEDKNTIYISVTGVRISFISYKHKLLDPFLNMDNINLSGIRDISCNKLSAISSRGSKKDFIDLFYILKKCSFEDILKDYVLKFGENYFNKYLILKSLGYFEDADSQPMPIMIDNTDWEDVKRYFVKLVKNFDK